MKEMMMIDGGGRGENALNEHNATSIIEIGREMRIVVLHCISNPYGDSLDWTQLSSDFLFVQARPSPRKTKLTVDML